MPRLSAAAATVLAVSLCLSAAEAASVRNPVQSVERAPPEITQSVGDPFMPRPKAGKKVHVFAMSCEVTGGHFANGAPVIKMVNTGSHTIPAGSVIEVSFPNGTTKKFTTPTEIKPGGAVSIMGPLGATPENFPCTAEATGSIANQAPDASNGPGPNQSLPPKLACEFAIVGGKLVVTFKNVGGSPLPAKQFLHAGPEGTGYGVSHYLQQDIPPGESVQLVYDTVDPALFAGLDCTATIMD